MERVYFSINEAGAKTANDMMSFSEYKTGEQDCWLQGTGR